MNAEIKKYVSTYVLLIALLALSASLPFQLGMIGGLTIGALKAALIVANFMHAKKMEGAGKIILGMILFLISLVFLLTLDFFTRT